MLDHATLGVIGLVRSMAFYERALKPLGIEKLAGGRRKIAGYGANGKAFFWIGERDEVVTDAHVAFAARDRPMVDVFHAAGLAAGGMNNRPPRLRQQHQSRLLRRVCARSRRSQYRGGLPHAVVNVRDPGAAVLTFAYFLLDKSGLACYKSRTLQFVGSVPRS